MTFSTNEYSSKAGFVTKTRIPPQPHTWPRFIFWWNIISIVLLLWDASFVLLRPASLPGNSLAAFFPFYDVYINVDTSYGDLEDYFVPAQSLLNLFEIVLHGIALVLYTRKEERPRATIIEFAASAMTCSKTVLYLTVEACSGFSRVTHNVLPMQALFVWFLPAMLWVVFPLAICIVLGNKLAAAISTEDHRASIKESRKEQ